MDGNNAISPLSQAERTKAIDSLLMRLDAIARLNEDGVPLYSSGLSNRWVFSRRGSWMGGFWAGLWWLRARISGAAVDRDTAQRIRRRLVDQMDVKTINRSMVFWYGAAPGALWFDDRTSHQMLETAAEVVAESFSHRLGCIPLGSGMGGGDAGEQCISIDALAPTLRLLAHSSRESIRRLGGAHLGGTLAGCGTREGAYHGQVTRPSYQNPTEAAGRWSRGQAWAMLALAQAAELHGEPFLSEARRACEYWLTSRTQLIPVSHLDKPQEGEDPSAAVLSAIAMLGLSNQPGQTDGWKAQAERILAAVVRSRYFISEGDLAGLFVGMRYRTGTREELVECCCSSFFLLILLLVAEGKIGVLEL
ncbi:hypothetical protein [Halomonas huangheensis]|uniref:Glucuronyl hydrolase n=1 Tax=Halomonas huangheensis TaxID=1178482 RepID=W1N1F8_9GAMM|nr:hypothetical protein [Halomonas huangheensis]ALM52377.1 hypothetical protein AR456_08845 [Halomonas huangheensis]ERL49319.1 hypothetical protein BJB45_07550 [Halomonas huangheensis]